MSQLERKEFIRKCFQGVEKYKRLEKIIIFGKELVSLPEDEKLDRFLVKGCVSKAWIIPEYINNSLIFKGDADALIVKGLLAILLKLYSGLSPLEIMKESTAFLEEIGLTELLSMNRRNGLANLFKQLKLYATAFRALHL